MKNIYKIDLVLIIGSLIVLSMVVGFVQPLVIAPTDDFETTETEVLFSIEKADSLLIDDNLDFSSPDEYLMKDGLKIDLKPGVYYWKAVGIGASEVRTLTIKSEVNLELRESNEEYSVVNVGNVVLNVDVYNGTDLVERRRLEVDEGIDGEGTSKFVGGMSDEK